jgi:hypothetical protein
MYLNETSYSPEPSLTPRAATYPNESVQGRYVPVSYVPVRYVPVRLIPVRYIPAFLHPRTFHS